MDRCEARVAVKGTQSPEKKERETEGKEQRKQGKGSERKRGEKKQHKSYTKDKRWKGRNQCEASKATLDQCQN